MQFSTHFSPPNAQNPLTWNWDISDNDELDIPKQEFTLDLSFLQNSKKGLSISANCREWLEKLNIYSWQDLVILSPMKNAENLMRILTIGGYHKYRQDLRKLLCFGKICNPQFKNATPTPNNTRQWHIRYLHRLHNDLPFLPTIERQGIANILSRSLISPVDPLNPTPPDFITVPHVQQLHSERGGEIQNSTQNPIEKNGNKNEGILKCLHENEINNDEYIEETTPEHEENSTHMIRTDQIPTVFRSPSHWEHQNQGPNQVLNHPLKSFLSKLRKQ